MKLFGDIRAKFEKWLIDDVLDGAYMYTNTNADSNDFIMRHGINQLCLLEMYDDVSQNFYGPDTAGFGFIVSLEGNATQNQLEVLKQLADELKDGFGLQISSIYGDPKLIISVTYDVAFSDDENVAKMNGVKSAMKDLLMSAFNVANFTADDFVLYVSKLCKPAYFWQAPSLSYQDDFFIRDQIAFDEEIDVKKSQIGFDDVVMTALGVQQYFSQDIDHIDIQTYLDFLDSKAFSVDADDVFCFTLGVYKPNTKANKKGSGNYADALKRKPYVYHAALYFQKSSDAIDEKIEALKQKIRLYDYRMDVVKNKQLAAVVFSLPMSLSAQMVEDVFSLRLAKNVESLSLNDIFPLLCNASASSE